MSALTPLRSLRKDLAHFGPATAATVVQNLGNLVVHAVAARALGPAGYAVVGVVLALGAMITIPLAAVQAAVTRAVAEAGERSSAGPVVRRLALLSLAVAAVTLAVCFLAAAPLRVPVAELTLVLPLWVAASVFGAGLRGVAIGRHRGGLVAGSLLVSTVVRVGGVAASVSWAGHTGPLVATVVAELAGLVVLAGGVRVTEPDGTSAFGLRDLAGTMAVTLGLWAFTSVDALLARLWLSDVAGGWYVAASTLGKTVLAVPAMAIALAMPSFSRRHAEPQARAARSRALVRIGALGAVAGLALAAVAGWLVPLLLGREFTGAVPATRLLALAVAGSAPISLQVNYLMARRSGWANTIWLAALAEVAGIALWHGSPAAIALVSLGVVPVAALLLYGGRR